MPKVKLHTEGISGLVHHSAMAGPLSTTKGTERKVQFHKKRIIGSTWSANAMRFMKIIYMRAPNLKDFESKLTSLYMMR